MSKTTNLQKVECLKLFLDQLKKGRKYQKPKITLEDLTDIKSGYAYKGNE